MKNRSVRGGRIVAVFGAILLTAFLYACQTAGSSRIGKADPATLKPGLAVLYYYQFWGRHLDALFSNKLSVESGKPGEPVPYLNHDFGKGNVFGSGRKAGIGVQLEGYIRMTKPGEYGFRAYANDGIRVFVDGQVIVEDPVWHEEGSRYSDPLSISVTEPGWYPILVRYFQRKGTAVLKVYWKKPGAGDYEIIPAEAYGHEPSQIKKK
jgi:hypothetical protein